MTFLNGILAFGAAAFTVPLIIHLLNRSRFRTIEWGAMHLLESVLRVNNKRIRIEQLLLLLVRCAIPILLALCLARPVLTGWKTLPGDVPASTVVLLDNSYSMDAATGDRAHFAEAVEQATAIVESLGRGSEVSVVRTGGGAMPVFESPIFDTKIMAQRLQQLPGGYGATDVAGAFESAMATLAGMTNARRSLILVSDFQRNDWESLPPTAVERIRTQLNAMPIPPALSLLHVGRDVRRNVAVESIEFSSMALGVGQELMLRANLRNFGPDAQENARVILRVDNTQHTVSQVTLGANASTQVLFTCQFKSPGSHVVEVEAVVEDELPTDNRYAAAVSVLEKIEVLLVDGAPSSEPLRSETDFVAVALTPYTFGRVKLSDLIETRTVTTSQLTEETLAAARVAVLANVAKVNDAQLELLSTYVRGGGGLLVFVGDKINIDWYNRQLYADSAGLLPQRIDSMGGSRGDLEETTRIVAQHFEHPALQLFNDRTNGNLADAEIRKWYRFVGRGDESAAEEEAPAMVDGVAEPVVLARLETGDPFLVERRVGQGLVMQVATACDADWGNLPMRPFYLPLMQQLVISLATQVTPPRNIQTGDPLVALLPAESIDTPLSLTSPDGTRHTVRAVARGARGVVQFDETQRPGVYTLTGSDGRPRHFVAETSRNESDVRLLDAERLDRLALDLGGELVASSRAYLESEKTRRHGREVWRILFWGVLGLMFGELVLQQRFTRVRS